MNKKLVSIGLCLFAALSMMASALTATADWNPNPVEDSVVKYRVSWGTVQGQYTQSVETPLAAAGQAATTVVLPNLLPGTTYYVVVEAFNDENMKSEPSDPLIWTSPKVPSKPSTPRITEVFASLSLKMIQRDATPEEIAAVKTIK